MSKKEAGMLKPSTCEAGLSSSLMEGALVQTAEIGPGLTHFDHLTIRQTKATRCQLSNGCSELPKFYIQC